MLQYPEKAKPVIKVNNKKEKYNSVSEEIMKKFIALVLAALMCLSVFALTGCSDPLKEKGNELAEVKNAMGDAYYWANYWLSYNGILNSEDEQYTEINEQMANWKTYIKEAGLTVDGWLDLDEEQMNAYIAEWQAETAKMQAIVDQYAVETEEGMGVADEE